MEWVQLIVDVDVQSWRNTLAVYVVSDVFVRDAEAVQTYRTRAADSITKYGGKYLVRGGEVQALEGTWIPPNADYRRVPQQRAGNDLVWLS